MTVSGKIDSLVWGTDYAHAFGMVSLTAVPLPDAVRSFGGLIALLGMTSAEEKVEALISFG